MESDCLSLLPSVCKVLANPKLLLPDDTSLEKLLDWFRESMSQSYGKHIIPHQPSLLQFLLSVTTSQEMDPTVFSFALKLTGLLASKEDSFNLLEEKGMLQYMFEPDNWHKLDLWKNASVRCGWLQGLWNMLQHQQAMDFFCKRDLVKLVLYLQNDKSLFIASLTNQVLAHFLNSTMLSNDFESVAQNSPASTDWASVTTKVMIHMAKSLASEEQAVVLSGLRQLAVVLTQCREPLKEMLWTHVLEPLELLANLHDGSLTQHIMAVLQVSARSPLFIKPECRVEALMEAMLCSRNANTSVQCAALILQLENCPETLERKATNVLLHPLLFVTSCSLQPHGPDYDSLFEEQLTQRISCVPLITQSLSSIADLVCKSPLDDIPVRLITLSVISLLRICLGHHSTTLQKAGTYSHLIGCCKVQRCSLDVLGSLAACKENADTVHEALAVLLLYLQCPDVHATVLKKTHQAILKWFSICSPSTDLWKTVHHDLFPLLKKHVCDGRWEVRDSTLEFIMQLTATLKGNSKYVEALHDCGMVSVLFTSLSDVEGYVRASAVAALGETLTTTDLQLSTSLQEEAVKHLLTILTEDTDSFPRRAVMKVFTSWLKSTLVFTALDHTLSSVLSLGSSDFDWEVKVHTLELADVLMDSLLNCCPYSIHTFQSSDRTGIKQALNELMVLGLFDLLLKCLFECDRPVSEKACALLLKLQTFMRETFSAGHSDLTLEISGCSWSEEMLQRCYKKQQGNESNCMKNGDQVPDLPKKVGLFELLELLDLEDMQYISSLSSDHVINSPQSIMEDILFAAQQSEENVVDCY
ncbi:BRCA1-associated ATM activator 1 [Pygocentrus nattereri]|uniref:BRCA1-associated ATM activator 1 n=1 Tax=Pygocentrus nattereri TaxID=42514 RepID=A0A3B4EHJ3_PYGNA|nr:BRCA1-associated ATM activator 1 [Pygocentrus nattereri]XP_017573238.1 BRCA1-associated ATM activator 1 [Pygocentrus nattereri]